MSVDRNLIARAIRPGELDLHFSLLCQAFDLDPVLARPIYDQDPFFAIDHKRALFDHGQMVAVLTVVPATLQVHLNGTLPVAGIAGVGVPPAFRQRGYASELLKQTLRALPDEFGYAVAALESDNPAFYRRCGFEHCSTNYEWRAAPQDLPDHPAASRVTQLEPGGQALESLRIQCLHRTLSQAIDTTFVRDERRWQVIETLASGRLVAVYRNETDAITSYVAYQQDSAAEGFGWTITEMFASDDIGRHALIGYLARQTNIPFVRCRMSRTTFHEFGLSQIDGIKLNLVDGVMMRLLDLQTALEQLAARPGFLQTLRGTTGGFTICLDDDQGSKRPKRLRLFVIDDARDEPRTVIAPADEIEGDCLSGDVGALTQLLLGYAPASVLRQTDRLHPTTADAISIANQLFTPTDLFLPLPDRF